MTQSTINGLKNSSDFSVLFLLLIRAVTIAIGLSLGPMHVDAWSSRIVLKTKANKRRTETLNALIHLFPQEFVQTLEKLKSLPFYRSLG